MTLSLGDKKARASARNKAWRAANKEYIREKQKESDTRRKDIKNAQRNARRANRTPEQVERDKAKIRDKKIKAGWVSKIHEDRRPEAVYARKLAKHREWEANNKEYRKNQRKQFPQRYVEISRNYRERNSDKIKEQCRKWASANRGAVAKLAQDKRARKLKATPSWANMDAIRRVYDEAAWLVSVGVDAHVDHIVPLKGKTVCGFHVEYNLRIITAYENRKKYNKLLETP